MSLNEKIKIIPRKLITDNRGWFLKVIDGLEENIPSHTGEVYLTNAVPGEAKGGHYHEKANEWFTLIVGECKLKTVDILTGEKQSLCLSSAKSETIYIPNHIAHIFINNSSEDFILLAYSDQLYLPEDTISFSNF
ncbi:WxcM-like domain-containing protein [Flavobacterium sp. HJJ]|uniref:polysaccharide biosynthesis C-terminal domain-containing protein n=1 Tax=Flavobacterium sp. HJJ TaxID=2783792 RepID=UPI00188D81B8|nr:WxcM-like domain-containing protein [Flavobacterium sp. HJJ]MBF4470268.1 WxcM-like domain-containing protein [Flavobacterium sp. HJJ]